MEKIKSKNQKIKIFIGLICLIIIGSFAIYSSKTIQQFSNLTIGNVSQAILGDEPLIVSASVDPIKIKVGDTVTITVEVQDSYGIEKVSAIMPHDKGADEIQMLLISGDNKNGKWQTQWQCHDTINKEYITKIVAVNILGKSVTKEVSWWDDTETVVYAGGLPGYSYRKKITISHSNSTGAGTDYQVPITIDSNGGSANVDLGGHCESFPNDIRFTDNDGETELDYWIEDTSADPITVWVEVADSLESSNVDIYVYYGKSGDSTTSSGTDTFLFFDDFTSDSWTDVGTPKIYVDTSNNRIIDNNAPRDAGERTYYSYDASGVNWILEWDDYIDSSQNWGRYDFGFYEQNDVSDDQTGDAVYIYHHYSGGAQWALNVKINGAGSAGSVYNGALDTWYYMRMMKTPNNAVLEVYSDSSRSTQVHSDTLAFSGDATLLYLQATTNQDGGSGFYMTGYIKNVRLRKYASTEPAFSSVGSETMWKKSDMPGMGPSGGGIMMF